MACYEVFTMRSLERLLYTRAQRLVIAVHYVILYGVV
jgi:hypothetical protein